MTWDMQNSSRVLDSNFWEQIPGFITKLISWLVNNNSPYDFSWYVDQTNSASWHPQKTFPYGDFLSGGKKLSGFQPGHEIDKTRVKSARDGQNDCKTFFMTSDSQKMTSRFLDSYFCTKFRISQPGWFADRGIKIRHMENFYRPVGKPAWSWNMEFCLKIGIQKI